MLFSCVCPAFPQLLPLLISVLQNDMSIFTQVSGRSFRCKSLWCLSCSWLRSFSCCCRFELFSLIEGSVCWPTFVTASSSIVTLLFLSSASLLALYVWLAASLFVCLSVSSSCSAECRMWSISTLCSVVLLVQLFIHEMIHTWCW